MKLLSTRSFGIGFLPSLRQRFSQDDWTLCTLTVGYFTGAFAFAGILLLLGGCSSKEGAYYDIGIKATVTGAPSPKAAPPTEPLQTNTGG